MCLCKYLFIINDLRNRLITNYSLTTWSQVPVIFLNLKYQSKISNSILGMNYQENYTCGLIQIFNYETQFLPKAPP